MPGPAHGYHEDGSLWIRLWCEDCGDVTEHRAKSEGEPWDCVDCEREAVKA